MSHKRLTEKQLHERSEIIKDMHKRIYEAIWLGIEEADPELLAANDGTPYCEGNGHVSGSLDDMAMQCAGEACKHMANWF